VTHTQRQTNVIIANVANLQARTEVGNDGRDRLEHGAAFMENSRTKQHSSVEKKRRLYARSKSC
jgi:hypothetical protein